MEGIALAELRAKDFFLGAQGTLWAGHGPLNSPTRRADWLKRSARGGKTGAEQLAEHCFRQALKGSARHAELFLAYTEGKPKQGVELCGPNGDAMKFENMSEAELDARLKNCWKSIKWRIRDDTGGEGRARRVA
jgi:hypothetical protein